MTTETISKSIPDPALDALAGTATRGPARGAGGFAYQYPHGAWQKRKDRTCQPTRLSAGSGRYQGQQLARYDFASCSRIFHGGYMPLSPNVLRFGNTSRLAPHIQMHIG
jgi:hypothetical protein